MNIKITIYKSSGKYYTSQVCYEDKNINLFDDEWINWLNDHLPAHLEEGYAVTEDWDSYEGFHNALYKIVDGKVVH